MAQNYSPQVPPTSGLSNLDLNELASQYAAAYGHDKNKLIRRITRSIIYDAAPKQFLDLAILSLKTPEQVPSDEFNYQEMGYGRDALVSDNLAATIASGASQVIPCTNLESVSKDLIITYPSGNVKGIVVSKSATKGAGNVTVNSLNNGTALPALAIGSSYTFAILSPVESDGADNISQYYRPDVIERYNYVQMLVKAMRFGKMELYKYRNAGSTSNYLTLSKQRFIQQFRTDLANIYWNGERGEVTLANGDKAKTAGGIYPLMVAAGSPNDSVTLSNSAAAVEQLALDTEFKSYGTTRFLYGTPRAIYALSKQFKATLVRYSPNDNIAKLGLSGIDIGSTMIVFVPIKRFEEPSCFPPEFRSKLILLDQESITPTYVFGEEMGDTLDRTNNGTLKNYKDTWISATFSLIFNNPLGGGYINITDLP